MFHRQRVLLRALVEARRPVTVPDLEVWAFRLARRTRSGGGSAFYQFVLTAAGPVSYAMRHELTKLGEKGHVARDGGGAFVAVPSGRGLADGLPEAIKSDVRRVVHGTALTETRSGASSLPRRPSALGGPGAASSGRAVFTVGYQGLQVDGFLDLLLGHRIRSLIDVRANPVARRYGFHRSTLSRLCAQLGIRYSHVPALGVPSQWRRDLRTRSDYARLLACYESLALPKARAEVASLAAEAGSTRAAIMCTEADPSLCHRSRLAREVARRASLPVAELRDPT